MFIPLHRHDDIECLTVLTGSLDIYRGNRRGWFTLRAGESIVVPPDVPHAIRNVTDAPADTLAIMTVRLARFVGELGEIAAAAGRERTREERMQSLHTLANPYGYWLASPAESEAIRHLPAVDALLSRLRPRGPTRDNISPRQGLSADRMPVLDAAAHLLG